MNGSIIYPITLGAEEELQVIDQHTLELVAHDFERGQLAFPDADGSSSCELHQAAVELQTPICHNPDAIVASMQSMRRILRQRAHEQGQTVLSAGVHPFSDWKQQTCNQNPLKHQHYIRLIDEYGDLMRGMVSYGFHLHLGLPAGTPAMPIFNCLRNCLAPILAISSSSPYFEQRDTGVQNWRHSMLDRLPRMGTPEIWNSQSDYEAHIHLLRKVGTLQEKHGMWEDLRLHHLYGTLEVRICDATPSLSHIWLICALLQCEAHTLVSEYHQGKLPKPLARAFLEENKWRVRRRGLAARLIDWNRETPIDLQSCFELWLQRLRPAATQLGLLERLRTELGKLFTDGTSADIQRRIFAQRQNYHDLVTHLVAATEEPFNFSLACLK